MAKLEALSRDDLVDIVRRVTPPSYHEPLEAAANGGWEIHLGQAAQLARVSTAVRYLQAELAIRDAIGAGRATGTAQFSRPTAAFGAATVKTGTRLLTASGLVFVTTADAVFGGADVGPVAVGARAAAVGYDYNIRAGEIAEILEYYAGSDEDPSMLVANAAAFSGGLPAALDALGWDRNVTRAFAEADDDFRARILALPDTVSPGAVDRLLEGYSARYVAQFSWSEHWEVDLTLDDDAYLDDETEGGIEDAVCSRGAFFVLVPDFEADDGGVYIDGDAYFDDDGFLDDYDAAKAAVGSGLLAVLDKIKAGGIAIVLVQPYVPLPAAQMLDNYSDDIEA